jgi:1-deoxy-D-xylulose 5-phosphate reductoisomerase
MIMTNTISILGSTGSIGRQTLEVAEHMGLRVGAITANSSGCDWAANCFRCISSYDDSCQCELY